MKAADDIDAFVGARVRLRRIEQGISQEHLGDALGLTFQQIQKYEKGQNRIGAGRLYRIARVLTVPVEFFYEGLPMPNDPQEQSAMAIRSARAQAFLATPEGHSLTAAFQRITDMSTRRRILDLVATIATEN